MKFKFKISYKIEKKNITTSNINTIVQFYFYNIWLCIVIPNLRINFEPIIIALRGVIFSLY